MIYKHFSNFVDCLLTFVIISFYTKVFNFNEVQILIYISKSTTSEPLSMLHSEAKFFSICKLVKQENNLFLLKYSSSKLLLLLSSSKQTGVVSTPTTKGGNKEGKYGPQFLSKSKTLQEKLYQMLRAENNSLWLKALSVASWLCLQSNFSFIFSHLCCFQSRLAVFLLVKFF